VEAPKRLVAIIIGVVALALTVTGVVVAATDPNPSGVPSDPLVLNGYPPKTATLLVTVDTGSAYQVTANLKVNFVANTLSGQVDIPAGFSTTSLNVLLVNNKLYLGLPNFASLLGASWLSTNLSTPNLYGLSLEMTKPDLSLITAYTSSSVSHDGVYTTYSYTQLDSSLGAGTGLPIQIPKSVTAHYSVTVGKQGEVVGATFGWTSKQSNVTVSAKVLAYNQPVHIVAPKAKDVKSLSSANTKKILGTNTGSLGNLLTSSGIASL
jgi:hypothetical protein